MVTDSDIRITAWLTQQFCNLSGVEAMRRAMRILSSMMEQVESFQGIKLETDHVLLEEAKRTAIEFLTVDEMIADYDDKETT